MGDVEQAIQGLAGPLRAEGRRGYQDTTIIGSGLAEYARAWAERAKAVGLSEAQQELCSRISAVLAGYGEADPAGRRELAGEAEGLLGGLGEGGAAVEGRAPTPTAGANEGGPVAKGAPRRELAGKDPARHRRDAGTTLGAASGAVAAAVLAQPVWEGKGRAPAWVERMASLGIVTNRDLLYHFPRDYTPVKRVLEVVDGERAAVVVTAGQREQATLRDAGRVQLVKSTLETKDDAGTVAYVSSIVNVPRSGQRAGMLRNSPKMLSFPPDTRLLIEGTVRRAGRFIEIQYGESERLAEGEDPTPGSLVPVYPLTDGLYQGQVRGLVRRVLGRLPEGLTDPLPGPVREKYGLPALPESLREIHWPRAEPAMEEARRRLTFEEMLTLQLAVAQRKREEQQPDRGIRMAPRGDIIVALEEVLPFSLTRAQQRVISEVAADMASDTPMCRLVQGDVGSGKTVVAAAALVIAIQNGYQGAVMAPTELLAEQHYLVLSHMLAPLGVEVALLTGSVKPAERERVYRCAADGRAQVVVGTQALIQEGVEFHKLGLVVVDEQHRFGVRQRAGLREKATERQPDMLVMTATPIPRTLALTVYGDLEVSILDEMPPGRTPIKTVWWPTQRQEEAYHFVRQKVAEGQQAYVVCPLIEESEALQAEAATSLAESLQQGVFSDLRVGLLHGAMKVAEKDEVMEAFRRGEVQVLVCTTVIEVGVDVPNATVMLILNAERFGLAQLHQLRGRVGRGAHRSTCVLLTHQKYDPQGRLITVEEESLALAKRRVKILCETTDGFKIAEEDLLLRGPGEFYGTRQHGLPDFRLARMATDVKTLEEAREAAFGVIAEDAELGRPEHAELRARVAAIRARMEEVAA